MGIGRKNAWLGSAILLAFSPAVVIAQQTTQSIPAPATQQSPASPSQKTKPAPAKSTKVWTEDDIASVRTAQDNYMDQQRAQEEAAAEAAATAKQQAAAAKPEKQAGAPLLSNPKSVDSADKMIAWEQKDIDSQQEYLAKLQKQLETAPPDQQAHIQAWIDQEIKTIADTKKEQAGLQAQKKDLEKKAAAVNNGAAQQQPQSQR